MGRRVRLSTRALARSVFAAASIVALNATSPAARAQLVFEPPRASDGGSNAVLGVVGDVDEDGLPDALVSRMQFLGPLLPAMLCRGQGDGGFAAPEAIPAPGTGMYVRCLADFNEDGHLDIVVGLAAPPPMNAAVRLGDGHGGFGAPVAINTIDSPDVDADVGDFDADGHEDVAIYNQNMAFTLGSVSVTFGRGDGTFEPTIRALVIYLLPADGYVIRAGDTNGDGFDDLVFTNTEPVLLSNGDRTFSTAPCSACFGFYVQGLALADLNGDGRDDAITPTEVLLAQPSGAFGPPQSLATPFVPRRVVAGDFDGDSLVDAAIARGDTPYFGDSGTGFGDVSILRGKGDGSFQAPLVVSHVPQPRDLAVADVDLDGRLDVVAASMQATGSTLRTMLNHTYPAGSAFTDVGGALGGSNGYPIQLASGTLVAGQPFAFKLFSGPPSGFAYHVVGLAALNAPFKGGTLVPFPHLLNGPLPLNPQGAISLAANWPAGGSGLTLWVQFWMPNGGGPSGFVASSGVRAQIP